MKKVIILTTTVLVTIVIGCYKPKSVLFEDNSSAIVADKSGWKATASSETPDGWENTGKASAVIDNNINTYWHSDYSATPQPGFPHWILIDMITPQAMVSVALTNRQAATPNTRGMRKFTLQGSSDGIAFTDMGTFDFAVTNASQAFAVSPATPYRYLRIQMLESNAAALHSFLAEVDIFTAK
jgi:hypothetical protein